MSTRPNIRQIEDGIIAPVVAGSVGQVLTADGTGGTDWTDADQVGGVIAFSAGWELSTLTAIADPGSGNIRTDAALSSTTILAISATANNTADAIGILATLGENDFIYIQEKSTPLNWVKYRINGTVVDNTTWFQIPVEFAEQGGTLAKGVSLFTRFAYNLRPEIQNIDSITFDTTAGVAVSEGQIAWNDVAGTLDIGLPGGSVLQTGQEFLLRALNTTGTTLVDGEAVYITGAQGNRVTVTRAQANDITADLTIGITTQPIPNNQEGFITLIGLVRDFDTSMWAEGAELWLSPTVPGGITNIKPTAPNHAVHIGFVVRSSATVGSIFVRITNEEQFTDLTDTPANYTGAGGQAVAVNVGETGLEFVAFPAPGGQVDSITSASGTIVVDNTDPANPDLAVNSSQTHLTFSLNTTDATGVANTIGGGSNGVITWDWDGTNTSVALQHNGNDRISVDENGVSIATLDGFVATTNGVSGGRGLTVDGFGSVVLRALGAQALQFENDANENSMSLGTNGTSGTNRNGVIRTESGTNFVGLLIRSTDSSRRVLIGAGVNDNIENLTAPQIGLEVVNDGSDNANVAFFGATPVAQPVLTTGTQEELAAALGSTSGLGLVDDSAVPSAGIGLEVAATQTANFTLNAPTRSPRYTVYPVDPSGGTFTGTLSATGWQAGDQFTVVDVTGQASISEMTIDFGTHNYFGTASHTRNIGDFQDTLTYMYVDATTGFILVSASSSGSG